MRYTSNFFFPDLTFYSVDFCFQLSITSPNEYEKWGVYDYYKLRMIIYRETEEKPRLSGIGLWTLDQEISGSNPNPHAIAYLRKSLYHYCLVPRKGLEAFATVPPLLNRHKLVAMKNKIHNLLSSPCYGYICQWVHSITPGLVNTSQFCQLRARRALSIFKNIPLRTRRGAIAVQSQWRWCPSGFQQNTFGDSALLTLNWQIMHAPSL